MTKVEKIVVRATARRCESYQSFEATCEVHVTLEPGDKLDATRRVYAESLQAKCNEEAERGLQALLQIAGQGI